MIRGYFLLIFDVLVEALLFIFYFSLFLLRGVNIFDDSSYFWIPYTSHLPLDLFFPEEARVNFLKDALKWDEIEGLMAKVKSSFLGVTDSLKSA